MRLLLIEDDPAVGESLQGQLSARQYVVDWATTLEDGQWYWETQSYCVVLLDLGLPGGNGLTLLRARREAGDSTPVLILTARNAWQERVEGLQAGADDYLGKPFHFEELLARIQALLRRQGVGTEAELTHGPYRLDLQTHLLYVGDKAITLTATEFRLLRLLMASPGKVFSKQAILEQITNDPYERNPNMNMVEVYIRRLRSYMGRAAIETLRGQGYRLRDEVIRESS